jgi:formamidopyrimidine-DNA glycosylase
MPELPEVETIVRDIAPRLQGRHIQLVEVFSPLVLRNHKGTFGDALGGRKIVHVRRHGKHVVLELDRGVLVLHLGMTGKLLFNAKPGPHTRAIFSLDDSTLVYDDIRMFGSLEFCSELPQRIERLGPEPFDIDPDEFARAVRQHRTSIKALILNQKLIRGMGNIYTDEALWRARIHPKTIASRIRSSRAQQLLGAIVGVLNEAIEHRGSSVSDYVDAEGRRGGFQLRHNVYGREGQGCPRCGTAIRRIVVAQRGTHYCPKCQRV